MTAYIAEFVGVALLILLGDGVVANVVLSKTKGNNGGGGGAWIVITVGWAMAVFVAVACAASLSKAVHLNPAVSITLAMAGKFEWANVPGYVLGQLLGGILGGILVYLHYRPHFADTADPDLKLATFCCAPQYRGMAWATWCEAAGTFVLAFAVLAMQPAEIMPTEGAGIAPMLFKLGALDALPVALVVLAIGLCLGGTTGYAINPARDLGPRIAHAILPIPGKRDSDWGYGWVTVIGPIIGGVVAAYTYPLLKMPALST